MINRYQGAARERRPRNDSRERGMVTAELAVGLLTATLVAAILAWVIGLAGLQARCNDTAAAVARQYARGDESAAIDASRAAPEGSSVQADVMSGQVRVVVVAKRSWGALGPISIEGRAQLTVEPGVGEA